MAERVSVRRRWVVEDWHTAAGGVRRLVLVLGRTGRGTEPEGDMQCLA